MSVGWKVRKTGDWLAWNRVTGEVFLFENGTEALQFVHEELVKAENAEVY